MMMKVIGIPRSKVLPVPAILFRVCLRPNCRSLIELDNHERTIQTKPSKLCRVIQYTQTSFIHTIGGKSNQTHELELIKIHYKNLSGSPEVHVSQSFWVRVGQAGWVIIDKNILFVYFMFQSMQIILKQHLFFIFLNWKMIPRGTHPPTPIGKFQLDFDFCLRLPG